MDIQRINTILTKAIVQFQGSEIDSMSQVFEAKKYSKKRAFIDQVMARHGTAKLPSIDMSAYPPIKGMEGPFRYRDGRVLYYDPKEGKYYDRKTDRYLSNKEIPM